MKIQKGQILTVQRYFNISSDKMEIIAEAGSDTRNSFLGSFIVKIEKKEFTDLITDYLQEVSNKPLK